MCLGVLWGGPTLKVARSARIPPMSLLNTSVPVCQWQHSLQLLLLGVQAWVLLLAPWVRRIYHLHKYQLGFVMAAVAIWSAVQAPCDQPAHCRHHQPSVLCMGLDPALIPHHSMVMSSPRLRGVTHTPTGDLCGCEKLHQSHCSVCQVPISHHLQRSVDVLARQLRVSSTAVTRLLRDLVVLMVNRLPTPPPSLPNPKPQTPPPPPPQSTRFLPCHPLPSSPLEPVHQLLHQLATEPSILSDTSPASTRATTDVSPTEGTPSQSSVTQEMVQKGLGTAGHCGIPPSLWQSHAPANFQWATDHAPQQRASQNPLLFMLASKLAESGLPCELPPHFLPNAKAYLKPKSAQKCALIVNMIPINDHCLPPPLYTSTSRYFGTHHHSGIVASSAVVFSLDLILATCCGRARCPLSIGTL